MEVIQPPPIAVRLSYPAFFFSFCINPISLKHIKPTIGKNVSSAWKFSELAARTLQINLPYFKKKNSHFFKKSFCTTVIDTMTFTPKKFPIAYK